MAQLMVSEAKTSLGKASRVVGKLITVSIVGYLLANGSTFSLYLAPVGVVLLAMAAGWLDAIGKECKSHRFFPVWSMNFAGGMLFRWQWVVFYASLLFTLSSAGVVDYLHYSLRERLWKVGVMAVLPLVLMLAGRSLEPHSVNRVRTEIQKAEILARTVTAKKAGSDVSDVAPLVLPEQVPVYKLASVAELLYKVVESHDDTNKVDVDVSDAAQEQKPLGPLRWMRELGCDMLLWERRDLVIYIVAASYMVFVYAGFVYYPWAPLLLAVPFLVPKSRFGRSVCALRDNIRSAEGSTPRSATERQKPIATKCLIKVYDDWYDLTQWKHYHPGGADILDKVAGTDQTDAFVSLHSEDAKVRLKRLPKFRGDVPDLGPDPSWSVAYQKWQDELRTSGQNDREFLAEVGHQLPVLTIAAVGAYLAYSWPITATLLLGLFQQQAGWIAHDNIHGRGRYCYWMGLVWGGWGNGMARSWWSDKHNTHHVLTNSVEHDSDIHNHPFIFNFPPMDDEDQWNRMFQHHYFVFLYPLIYISWRIQSLRFCISRGLWKELVLSLGPSYVFMAFLPLKVVIGSMLIGGLFVGFVVTMSHESEELHYDAPEQFVKAQFVSTRDIVCPNWFMNWFFGGMQYQLEHHLFPMTPRRHYPRMAKELQKFAEQHGLPYKASPLWEFWQVHCDTLRKTATAPTRKQHAQ
jgi:fatty acid desaturase